MNNKYNILIVGITCIAIAMWGVSELLTIRDLKIQLTILGGTLICLLLLTVKSQVALDGKLLIFCVFGYFIGGKGFSYLPIATNLYIGEVLLVVCTMGFLLRCRGNVFEIVGKDPLINYIVFLLIISGLRVFSDFPTYGLFAIRDFATVYYSWFAVCIFFLFRNDIVRSLFMRTLPYAAILGFLGYTLAFLKITNGLMVPWLYYPHPDAAIPVIVGLTVMALVGFKENRQMRYLATLLACFGIVSIGKAAVTVSLALTIGFVIIFARQYWMLKAGSVLILLATFGVAIDTIGGFGYSGGLMEAQVVDSFSGAVNNSGTSAWRIKWWTIVARDTFNHAPFLGTGFGSDISVNFYREVMKMSDLEVNTPGIPRFPHSIIFTILGRLGVVGVTLFIIYCILFLRFCAKYARLELVNTGRRKVKLFIFAYVLAGFANSFVQSTYENPYAAVLHWVFIGYLLNDFYRSKQKKRESLVQQQITTEPVS